MAVEVQAFYDRYPYPPPVADLARHRQRWQDRERRRADFHLFWPTSPYREDYYSLEAGLMARIPRALRIAQIPIEDQYAAAELFRGNMVRHSAIAYRNDNPRIPRISFDGDGWLGYVPIRIPDTLTVRERLPPGIAAILINRTHSHTDILLPVRPQELRVLAAVDGKRTIGEMLTSEVERDSFRSFFERLWWHDQVVFDAVPRV